MRKERLAFSESLQLRASPVFVEQVVEAANRDCATVSEWVRRACLDKLRSELPLGRRGYQTNQTNRASTETEMVERHEALTAYARG